MTLLDFSAFCKLPENRERRLELIRGEVVEFPIPYHKHGFVCAKVGFELCDWANRRRAGCVTSNCAGVILQRDPDSIVGPDLAYFESVAGLVDELTGWSLEPPTLAVEVISPQDDLAFLQDRVRDYLVNGVRVVWLVDYEAKRVAIVRASGRTQLDRCDRLMGGDELPDFACRVDDFFRLPGDRRVSDPAA